MFGALHRIFDSLIHPDRRTVSSVLELALIAAVVYAVLRFLRGTRGERLLRGMAVVLLVGTIFVSFLADLLELERIKVLYPPFLGAMVLVALVAFQPELRRALIRLGATRLFGGMPGEIDRLTESVMESVEYLARNKIGALIAFERQTDLSGFTEGACKIDAEISAALLNTIFWPGSALHDMGVVISNERINAAGVQFPFTESDVPDPSFGSRHRAAIGMSEETDAVVLVVSEESGIVSLFERGRMHRHLTIDTLRPLLRSLLGRPGADPLPEEAVPAAAADPAEKD